MSSSAFTVIKHDPSPLAVTISSGENRLEEVREMFLEYEIALEIDLCFQNFEAELASLPAPYDAIYFAALSGKTVGCVAFKPLSKDVCELKRLYVRPEARGHGVGRILCEHAMAEARKKGYRTMRLDTLARLESALRLYRALGFVETQPYHNMDPGEPLVYMERELLSV